MLVALALVFAGSCQRIEESFVNEGPVSGEKMTIEATLVESSPGEVSSDALETKSALQPNGVDIWWTPGDAINLFYGSSTKSKFTANITEPFPTASFEGSLGAATGSAEQGISSQTFWGVYPYDAENTCDGSSVTLKILETQVASAGSFGVGMNPSVANSPGLSLSFYNVGSWLRFSVSQPGITSATFSGNADEILAGNVTVTMDSDGKPLITNVTDGATSITVTPEDGGAFVPGQLYYITLIPQVMAATGYTLTLYKGNQMAKCVVSKASGTYEFARSGYRSKKNADEGLKWEDNFVVMAEGFIWAKCNVGANSPEEYGDYFAWGETTPKQNYSWSNYAHGTSTSSITKYNSIDGLTVLEATDDAATVNLGGGWRTPTEADWAALRNSENYDWVWTDDYKGTGVAGEIVTSKVSGYEGNSIFLPVGGFYDTAPKQVSGVGRYWSSSLYTGSSTQSHARYVQFQSDGKMASNAFRYYGQAVRAVCSSLVSKDYLCFTAEEDGTIALSNTGDNAPNVEYTTDGVSWTTWDYSAITVPAGGKVYFKGNNSAGFSTSSSAYSYFVMTGKIAASGSIQSLLYGDDFEDNLTIPRGSNCFYRLFYNCSVLTSAPELPAITLADYCYSNMFRGCYSLTSAPDLPATTLSDYCYYQMFYNCSRLTAAPDLPATTLARSCYSGMFAVCSSLTTAPELPATTLAVTCYANMFENCMSLVTAPELPATKMTVNCYAYMFRYCQSLTTAPALPATTLASTCYAGMFQSCTKLSEAPELPAAKLVSYCYQSMFESCTRLSYIKMMATDVSASSCLNNWVSGVNSTGTFVKNQKATLETGVSGIPEGWKVQEYVEMGDGLKWATVNVGATAPQGYGDYFAWGETQSKSNYSWTTYFDNPSGDGNTFIKYTTNKDTQLRPEDDAATVNWGGDWRMPTEADWIALGNSADFEWNWTDDYQGTGVSGEIVTSKVSGFEGNSIFLPACGYIPNQSVGRAGTLGLYWSSSLRLSGADRHARSAYFDSGANGTEISSRYFGISVRAVF